MNPEKGQPANVELGEANFDAEVLKWKQPVLVLFWAPWSRPCLILRPLLEAVAEECRGRAKVVELNVDDYPALGSWYAIESIPTLLFFRDGAVRARIVGTASKTAIYSKLKACLSEAG